jgi:hypothetical protein
MTTIDIARADANAVAVLGNSNDALARLGEWVQAARNAHQIVSPLIGTPFVPDAYKPRVDPRATDEQKAEAHAVAVANAAAAVLQGITLGIDPLMALQQIYIVHGRPGLYAKMMVALVQSRGHEVWTNEGECTDQRAVVYGRRRGSQNTERVIVTMDTARKAGWTSNQAYAKTPADMLWNRAAARVCDRIASDVLKGIASVEEIQDSIQATAEAGNGHRTVSPRRKAPARAAIDATTVDDPPLEETPAPAPLTSPSDPARHASEREPSAPPDSNVAAQGQAEPRLITQAQQRKLHALFREHDLADRDAGLLYIAAVIGHPLDSTKELTVDEAGAVIDSLETAPDDPEPMLDDA